MQNTQTIGMCKNWFFSRVNTVVLAHGMHSNLNTWDSFGEQLAESGRDTWQIEMYGGSTTECDTCGNYTFDDLKTHYWPALIAGVQEYSGQNDLSYVGYGLGCTVGLEALEIYGDGGNEIGYYFDYDTGQYVLNDITSEPVGTFVGVACLGNFTKVPSQSGEPHLSRVSTIINATYNKTRPLLNEHVNAAEIKIAILVRTLPSELFESLTTFFKNPNEAKSKLIQAILTPILMEDFELVGEKISLNVYDEVYNWINNESGPNIGENVNVDNFMIVQSEMGYILGEA